METGEINKYDIGNFLATLPNEEQAPSDDPIVVTFGLNMDDLQDHWLPVSIHGKPYSAICDFLENDLESRLRFEYPSICHSTEPSARSGETLSVRYAFWHANLECFRTLELGPWLILELMKFSEIYPGESWDSFKDAATARGTLDRGVDFNAESGP